MAKYKKCDRCDLNYIPVDEELCDVCKAELGYESKIVLLDDIIDDDEVLKLCPICKTAFIAEDETMCEGCIAERDALLEEKLKEEDDSWLTYEDIVDAEEDETEIPLDELDEEFEDELEFEDEENIEIELDDYDDSFDDEEYDEDEDADEIED